MTNDDWLRHFGLGWVFDRGTVSDERLCELKRMAKKAKPFAPDEAFPIITEELEDRARRNQQFFRAAVILVPKIINELLRFRAK